jgi:hypothetical protein
MNNRDPNRLYLTIQAIMGLLFDREEVQLDRRTRDLITKNQFLGGSPDGFKHLGKVYSTLTGYSKRLGNYTPLHNSLVEKLDLINSERETIERDKGHIKQALALSLRECQSFQDIRDALPNCISELLPECKSLERTRPEAYALADNERSYTQYMKLRENMEFYAASRLLY